MTIDLFDDYDYRLHWLDMPEFNQENEPDPEITATFKFRNEADYQHFKELLKLHVYDGAKFIDGYQEHKRKQSWYPLKEVRSNYVMKSTDPQQPKYPIYIVSKGRFTNNPTSQTLERLKVPYHMVVEQSEYEQYCKLVGEDKVLILPQHYKDDYDTFWVDDDPRVGPGPARNFAWDHSMESGHKRHWVMDDNIEWMKRLNRNQRIRFSDGTCFTIMENFVDRYTNVVIAGPQYNTFCHENEYVPPFLKNRRIYSCLLIDNSIPYRWRGRYNEDTDICLRVLKDGLCTIQFHAVLQDKMSTQKLKGGNTQEFYEQDGTLLKSKMLEEMHPDVAKVTWRFNRWHHWVDYKPFERNKLIRVDPDIVYDEVVNNYGLEKIYVK